MILTVLAVAIAWTAIIAILIWRITRTPAPPRNPPPQCPLCHDNHATPWQDNPDLLN